MEHVNNMEVGLINLSQDLTVEQRVCMFFNQTLKSPQTLQNLTP